MGSAVNFRVEVPNDLVPLLVPDKDAVRLVKGEAHGEVLRLVNIVRLEEVPVGGLRLGAIGVYSLVYAPMCQKATVAFAKNQGESSSHFPAGKLRFLLPLIPYMLYNGQEFEEIEVFGCEDRF